MRRMLGLLVVIGVPAAAAGQDDPLVGSIVFAKSEFSTLWSDDGRNLGPWGSAPGRVVKVAANGRVQIVGLTPSHVPAAWVRRTQLVPLADAAAFYSDRLRAAPDDAWALEMRASVYAESREPGKAVDDLTEAIRLAPNARRHFLRAIQWSVRGDAVKAVADYTTALHLDPADYYALHNRGRLYTQRKEYNKAEADFAEAVRLQPYNPVAYQARGQMWDDRGVYGKAITDHTEAIRLAPQFVPAYLDRAHARLAVPDPAAALTDYAEAVRLEPTNSDAHYGLGYSWDLLKDRDKAFESFREAARLAPTDPLPRIALGNMWFEKGDPDKAVAAYTRAIRSDPKAADAYCRRGEAWDNLGAFDKAVADYSQAVRLNPDFVVALERLAWVRATCPVAKHRDGEKAVELATRLCDLSKSKVALHLDTLAAAHAEAGDFAKAVEAQKRALALPGLPPAWQRDFRERLDLYEAEQPYRQPPRPMRDPPPEA